jgi:hypothetical protein
VTYSFVTRIKCNPVFEERGARRLPKTFSSSDRHILSIPLLSNYVVIQVCIAWGYGWVRHIKICIDAGYGEIEDSKARTIFVTGINTASQLFGRINITSLSYRWTTTCRPCMEKGRGGDYGEKGRVWGNADFGRWMRSRDTHCQRAI